MGEGRIVGRHFPLVTRLAKVGEWGQSGANEIWGYKSDGPCHGGTMMMNGPICPNCQKALSYGLGLRTWSLTTLRCPNCSKVLRRKGPAPLTAILLCFASIPAGLGIAVPICYFYCQTYVWTMKQMLLCLVISIVVVAFVFGFIYWKIERLVVKDNDHDAPRC